MRGALDGEFVVKNRIRVGTVMLLKSQSVCSSPMGDIRLVITPKDIVSYCEGDGHPLNKQMFVKLHILDDAAHDQRCAEYARLRAFERNQPHVMIYAPFFLDPPVRFTMKLSAADQRRFELMQAVDDFFGPRLVAPDDDFYEPPPVHVVENLWESMEYVSSPSVVMEEMDFPAVQPDRMDTASAAEEVDVADADGIPKWVKTPEDEELFHLMESLTAEKDHQPKLGFQHCEDEERPVLEEGEATENFFIKYFRVRK
jgi:hypothetical protein